MTEINLQYEALFAKRPEIAKLFEQYVEEASRAPSLGSVLRNGPTSNNKANEIINEELGHTEPQWIRAHLYQVFTYWDNVVRRRCDNVSQDAGAKSA